MADIREENLKLGLKLQDVRKENGYSQDEAADYIGINKDTLSNYETGKTKIPAVICRKLSKLYKVPYDEFWEEEDKDIAKELHSIIDISNEKEVRYLYNIALGMQALRV